jgi:hypothetical protein
MGCEGCHFSEKEQARRLSVTIGNAKTYAIQHQKNCVVYAEGNGSFSFIEAAAAAEIGITPIQFVSFHRPVTDG